jgi:hypothetical protein
VGFHKVFLGQLPQGQLLEHLKKKTAPQCSFGCLLAYAYHGKGTLCLDSF